MDTQIEQLNLSSITKFALAYAGITTVSELKEYNYANNRFVSTLKRNRIMKTNYEIRYAAHPEDAKSYDCRHYRRNFLIEKVLAVTK